MNRHVAHAALERALRSGRCDAERRPFTLPKPKAGMFTYTLS